MGRGVPVGVLLVIDEHLLVVEAFLLCLGALLLLFLPLVLLPLHALLQAGIIEILHFFLVVLALDLIVDIVVLIEPFLFWV